jgi:hypothetical protein
MSSHFKSFGNNKGKKRGKKKEKRKLNKFYKEALYSLQLGGQANSIPLPLPSAGLQSLLWLITQGAHHTDLFIKYFNGFPVLRDR